MNAIMKNVKTDSKNEDLINFAQTIDFTELFEQIKNFTGIKCSFYQPEIQEDKSGVYINIMSADITRQAGLFAAILKKCYLHSFNNGVYRNGESGELGYGVNVNIRYEHKDGGSNGMDVVSAYYTESKGWIFRNAGER